MNKINVLSVFDGMSCGKLALDRAGIHVDKYYASEIDKHAEAVSNYNFPDINRLGDVTKVRYADGVLYSSVTNYNTKIDLLIGGSPCQGFSFAGKQLNFDDPRSKLFFEFVRLLKECNPKYFLLENVKMKKEHRDVISSHLGVEPIEINSAMLSAQNRKRLYWTNIPNVSQPNDRDILLKDIIQHDIVDIDKYIVSDEQLKKWNGSDRLNPDYKSQANTVFFDTSKSPTLCAGTHGYAQGYIGLNYSSSGRGHGVVEGRYSKADKSLTLTAQGYGNRSFTGIYQINPDKSAGGKQPHMQNRIYHSQVKSVALTSSFASRLNILDGKFIVRKLTPVECERLQTVPDNFTSIGNYGGTTGDDLVKPVSNTQRYKMLGNSWTVDVISHIFSFLKLLL